MMRTIHLEGEMGRLFGTNFQVYAPAVKDVLSLLEANFPNFKKYLVGCHEKDIGFTIDVADNHLDYEAEMLMKLNEGDITITPMAAGSKSALGKILAAIALIVIMVTPGLRETFFAGGGGGLFGLGTLTVPGKIFAYMAVNLAMMGIQQMMAPDPASDSDQEESYLFNGAEQNIVEGDPVPLLYGKLRVPGQPVSFEIAGIDSVAKANMYRRGGGSTGGNDQTSGTNFTIAKEN